MIKIMEYGQLPNSEIFARDAQLGSVSAVVAEIIDTVRREGDRAVFAYNQKFDGAALGTLEVSAAEIKEAFEAVEPKFLDILNRAAENIRAFHQKQVRNSFIINEQAGVITGQKFTPIERVGLYVPGGTAAYPSTVLMDSIPAQIAGCREIVMVTPPGKDGRVSPVILAAAGIAGVHRIFKVAARRRLRRWPSAPRAFPGSIKSWGRAMRL